jgi:hypothetical protein
VLYRLALATTILLGIAARSMHMTDMETRGPDEYSYTVYAATLADGGLPAYRAAFTEYNQNREFWVHPSPARFGYVVITAAVMKATGNRNARSGAAVSWFFSCLSLVLVAWLGLRFFNPPIALLATFFLALNIPELAMARRAWQDATFGFLGLCLVALAAAITAHPNRKRLWIAFCATGAWCLLIKESGYVAYGLCWIWLLYATTRYWKRLLLGGLASAALAVAILAFLAGGLQPVVDAQRHILTGTAESAYGYYYDGPWHQFFYLFWLTGPFTAIMALAGLAAIFLDADRLRDSRAAHLALWVTAFFICIGAFGPELQYLRLTSPVHGTYSLIAATGLWSLYVRFQTVLRRRTIAIPLTAATLFLMAAHDYPLFVRLIVDSDMQDLAGRTILTTLGK